MDATLKAPFCHMRQPRCAARRYSAIAYEGEAAAGLPCASGEAAAVAAALVTAITVQSLLAVAQRERGSF